MRKVMRLFQNTWQIKGSKASSTIMTIVINLFCITTMLASDVTGDILCVRRNIRHV